MANLCRAAPGTQADGTGRPGREALHTPAVQALSPGLAPWSSSVRCADTSPQRGEATAAAPAAPQLAAAAAQARAPQRAAAPSQWHQLSGEQGRRGGPGGAPAVPCAADRPHPPRAASRMGRESAAGALHRLASGPDPGPAAQCAVHGPALRPAAAAAAPAMASFRSALAACNTVQQGAGGPVAPRAEPGQLSCEHGQEPPASPRTRARDRAATAAAYAAALRGAAAPPPTPAPPVWQAPPDGARLPDQATQLRAPGAPPQRSPCGAAPHVRRPLMRHIRPSFACTPRTVQQGDTAP